MRHESGCVLGQRAVADKSNEITAVPLLLAGRPLCSTVTTMDALLTQHAIARQIRAQQGHYLLVVKENQPELYAHIALLFQTPPVPVRPGALLTYSGTEERSHGRLEMRTLESRTALADYLAWPGAAQVMRRTCRRVILRTGAVSSKTTYGITSLGRDLALPAQIEAFWRGHWTIETKVHYVRDETLARTAANPIPAVPRKLSRPCVTALSACSAIAAGTTSLKPCATMAPQCSRHCNLSAGPQLETTLSYTSRSTASTGDSLEIDGAGRELDSRVG